MILYTNTFPLGKGMTFSHYMDVLDETNFSPYTLLITRIPGTKKARIEVVFTNTSVLGVYGGGFVTGQVLFNEIMLEYSEKRSFLLQASIGVGNLVMPLFYIVLSAFFLLFVLFEIIAKNMSLGNMFAMLSIPAIMLFPLIMKYFQEIKFLDRIGSLASETGKNA